LRRGGLLVIGSAKATSARRGFLSLINRRRADPHPRRRGALDIVNQDGSRSFALDAGMLAGGCSSSGENQIVDEFENMSDQEIEPWLDAQAEARVKVRQRSRGSCTNRRQPSGVIGTLQPTTAQGKPH
jgi:hypothetical protein